MQKKHQIGLRVRAYRLEQRLTQERLAEMIDRSVETISNLERGISLPNEATLRRLARSLDVAFEDLLIERSSGSIDRPIEFFRATELLKTMDEKQLKLAYNILKLIANV